MDKPASPPTTTGRHISRLTVVTAGGKTYIGRKAKEQPKQPLGGRCVILEDTLLLLISMTPDPSAGGIRSQIMPSPVAPMQKPCVIKLWADSEIDMSGDAEMGQFYSALTGNSGLVIPGLG